MESSPVRNDFRKAMGSAVLTAGAALADAQRAIDKPSTFGRKKAQQEMRLAVEFCRLLMKPVDECGPGFSEIPGFAETYCREHLSAATAYCREALASHEADSPEARRLAHIARLIEANIKKYLDGRTAEACWFGTPTI
jgi:hypothetical protein